MNSMTGSSESTTKSQRWSRPGLFSIAWAGLLLLGAFPVLAAAMDLLSVARTGIPSDHQAAFQAVTGMSAAAAQAAAPGLVHYVRLLEIGYAAHELVFGALFLAIVAFPLRGRQRWAWWSCWAVLAADVVYTATFGAYSDTILRQSLIADIALPALLIASAPGVFRRRRGGDGH